MKVGKYTLTNATFSKPRLYHLGYYKRDYERQDRFVKLFGYFLSPLGAKIIAICKKSHVNGSITITINTARFGKEELQIPELEVYMIDMMTFVLDRIAKEV